MNNQDDTPIYKRLKAYGKKRRVRKFGAVIFTDKYGKAKEIRPAQYLYIKNEPNTEFTPTHQELKGKGKSAK